MDAIRIEIEGERQAGLRFEQFPDALYGDLRDEIESLTGELFAMVQARTPADQGELRSQERMRVYTDKDRVSGVVSVVGADGEDYAKAAALEYGARRDFQVQAFRRKLDHFWGEKLARPITVMVQAYRRTPNIAEHSFLRGSLDAMRSTAVSRLNAVIEKSTAAANA